MEAQEIRLERPYPLFKVEQEDIPRKDNTTSLYYSIYVKVGKDYDWFLLYGTASRPWSELALDRLREIFDIHIFKWLVNEEENAPVMFMIDDQMYKTTHIIPHQSCICGETIEGNQRYAEFSVDSIKFDYITSLVTFFYKGDCIVKANQLFLNGELLCDSKQLKDLCDSIGQDFNKLDYDPYKLTDYLVGNYNIKSYTCGWYTSYFK